MKAFCFEVLMPFCREFIESLCSAARRVGMQLPMPEAISRGRNVRDVSVIMNDMYRKSQGNLKLVLAILPSGKNNDIYGKQMFECISIFFMLEIVYLTSFFS